MNVNGTQPNPKRSKFRSNFLTLSAISSVHNNLPLNGERNRSRSIGIKAWKGINAKGNDSTKKTRLLFMLLPARGEITSKVHLSSIFDQKSSKNEVSLTFSIDF